MRPLLQYSSSTIPHDMEHHVLTANGSADQAFLLGALISKHTVHFSAGKNPASQLAFRRTCGQINDCRLADRGSASIALAWPGLRQH